MGFTPEDRRENIRRVGEIAHMTGISSPYEAPEAPEIRVGTVGRDVEDIVAEVVGALKERGIVSATE